MIDYCHDETHKYILIDIGKTFREQVLRWFVHHKVPSVDSVRFLTVHSFSKMILTLSILMAAALRGFSALQIILTHEHADAVLGLDEVWVVQPRNGRNDIEQIPIFLTQFTMDRFTFTSSFFLVH